MHIEKLQEYRLEENGNWKQKTQTWDQKESQQPSGSDWRWESDNTSEDSTSIDRPEQYSKEKNETNDIKDWLSDKNKWIVDKAVDTIIDTTNDLFGSNNKSSENDWQQFDIDKDALKKELKKELKEEIKGEVEEELREEIEQELKEEIVQQVEEDIVEKLRWEEKDSESGKVWKD